MNGRSDQPPNQGLIAEQDGIGSNRQTGQLFYWPRAEFSAKTEVIAPRLGRVLQVLGDAEAERPVSYLSFSGPTFQETDYSPNDGCVGYGMGNDGVVYLKNATECTIENCTFRNIGKYAVCLSGGCLDNDVIRIDHNLYSHAGGKEPIVRGCASFADWQQRGFDQNSVIADPLFVDSARDDYTLRPDSPAFELGFEPKFFRRRIGELPERTALEARVIGKLEGDGFGVEKGIYASQPRHHVTALV